MILVELTKAQREFIAVTAHKRMDEIMSADSNAWVTSEYTELESLMTQLYIDCAE